MYAHVEVAFPENDSDTDTILNILMGRRIIKMKQYIHFFLYATGIDLILKEIKKIK